MPEQGSTGKIQSLSMISYLKKASLRSRFPRALLLTTIGGTFLLAPTLLAPQLTNQRVRAATLAEVMRSSTYEIQLGHFNMTSGEKSSTGYKVTDTVGQTAAGEFNSTGYNVYAGFQYLYALSEFSFQIDSLSIALGELQPGQFSTGSNQLTISTRSGGYTVYAGEIHPLQLKNNPATFIPNTSCDSSCSISTAAPWVTPSNVGFGFNVSGTHASSDFVDGTYYRPFANRAGSEQMQAIAASASKVTEDVLTVTYQASIDQSQGGGNYETAIEYLAIPSY